MAKIALTCGSGCGDVEVDAATTRTHTYTGDGSHSLTYRCPRCRLVGARAINDAQLELCAGAGVAHTTLQTPEELADPDRISGRDLPDAGELTAALELLESIGDVESLLTACR